MNSQSSILMVFKNGIIFISTKFNPIVSTTVEIQKILINLTEESQLLSFHPNVMSLTYVIFIPFNFSL